MVTVWQRVQKARDQNLENPPANAGRPVERIFDEESQRMLGKSASCSNADLLWTTTILFPGS